MITVEINEIIIKVGKFFANFDIRSKRVPILSTLTSVGDPTNAVCYFFNAEAQKKGVVENSFFFSPSVPSVDSVVV